MEIVKAVSHNELAERCSITRDSEPWLMVGKNYKCTNEDTLRNLRPLLSTRFVGTPRPSKELATERAYRPSEDQARMEEVRLRTMQGNDNR